VVVHATVLVLSRLPQLFQPGSATFNAGLDHMIGRGRPLELQLAAPTHLEYTPRLILRESGMLPPAAKRYA